MTTTHLTSPNRASSVADPANEYVVIRVPWRDIRRQARQRQAAQDRSTSGTTKPRRTERRRWGRSG